LALHELATNSGKYGALSNHEGRVRIFWQITAAATTDFSMSWSEDGGPAVRPPTHHGFGRKVIGQLVESAIHGKAEVDYCEKGFSWKLTAPAKSTLELFR
jgi:two-component sensor histidine kinase